MLPAKLRFKPMLATLATLAVIMGAAIAPAFAQHVGTPAFADKQLSMHEGPSVRYQIVGVVPYGRKIVVNRCSGLWCNISVANRRGWVLRYALSFGQGPHSLIWWDFL